jgi:hypothetical protein
MKADIWSKYEWIENVEIINIQIIPRRNTYYPYSEEYPSFEDEYNVIYLDITDNKIKHGVISRLDDDIRLI